jgi:hypothetical protein
MHFEDGVDRFLFGLIDEAARVDDQHIGLFRLARQVEIILRRTTQHDLGVDQVFGAAEADHADFGTRGSHEAVNAGGQPGGRIKEPALPVPAFAFPASE